MDWINAQRFEHGAQTATFLDYRNEVEHQTERVAQIEKAIDQAIEQAPERMQEIIKALQSLRGVAKITAVTLVSEIGSFERFSSAPKFMAYLGLVPCEYSSGKTRIQGRITKTGNAHMRRVLGEAAFCSRLHPRRGPVLKKRQQGQSQAIVDISWQAQKRLYAKHTRMMLQRKSHQVTVTALGRELAGFVWSVARQRETELAN